MDNTSAFFHFLRSASAAGLISLVQELLPVPCKFSSVLLFDIVHAGTVRVVESAGILVEDIGVLLSVFSIL